MAVGDWCILIFAVVVNDWRISILIVQTIEVVPSHICCGTDQLLCCLTIDKLRVA